MPELPEVETIVRELQEKICGETISDLEKKWSGSFVNYSRLSIKKRRIEKISRKGKYILFHLDSGYLITHLRMTGQLIVRDSAPTDLKHLRLSFKFSSGKYLLFYDLRKFGRISLTPDPNSILNNTGMDALDSQFSTAYLRQLFKNRKIRIKSFLLNQKYIAGLGNIYIDEILFRAGIHPASIVSDLSKAQIRTLYNCIKFILNQAIQKMGTTISDYKTSGGGFGENQNYLQVYGREGKHCFKCDSQIIKIKHSGRGTHYCPTCQPGMTVGEESADRK